MGRQEGGAHCRVLNIGFRLINWAENGVGEPRVPGRAAGFRRKRLSTLLRSSEADVSPPSELRL